MKGPKTSLLICDSIFTARDGEDDCLSGYILIEDGLIAAVESGSVPTSVLERAGRIFDYRGQTISPGLVDPHTHLVFGASREHELGMKLSGMSYLDIHKAGGGIHSTVRATREATDEELFAKAASVLETMLKHGTTSMEAKSGYGLDLETELRTLRLLRELEQAQPITIVASYMGAHAIPAEYKGRREDYIRLMIDEVMPQVKREGLAEFVDIFCEEGIFSIEESRRLALAAKSLGFRLKIHADEIVAMGGGGLAAELSATSAEHLMAVSDEDIRRMAEAGVIAVLLPATSFFLMSERFAPARKMIEAGVTVALATDFNPGSSPCENLQMAMSMACYVMKLRPAEIFRAVTIHAARAIGRERSIGSLEVGKDADLAVFRAANLDGVLYHFAVNGISDVFKKGTRVIRDGLPTWRNKEWKNW